MRTVKKFGIAIGRKGEDHLEQIENGHQSEQFDLFVVCVKIGPVNSFDNYYWQYNVCDSNGNPAFIEIGRWKCSSSFQSFVTWRQQGIYDAKISDPGSVLRTVQFDVAHPQCLNWLIDKMHELSAFGSWKESDLSEQVAKLQRDIVKLEEENQALKKALQAIKKTIKAIPKN